MANDKPEDKGISKTDEIPKIDWEYGYPEPEHGARVTVYGRINDRSGKLLMLSLASIFQAGEEWHEFHGTDFASTPIGTMEEAIDHAHKKVKADLKSRWESQNEASERMEEARRYIENRKW